MIHLIWTFINVGAALFFIYTAFRAVKLVAEKYGLAATLVLIFGILGIMSSRSDATVRNTVNNRLKYTFVDRDSVRASNFSHIKVKNDLISNIELITLIGKYGTTDSLVVVEANAAQFGFSSGVRWVSDYVEIMPVVGSDQFRYSIYGTKSWSLLGVDFYTHSTNYEGSFSQKSNH